MRPSGLTLSNRITILRILSIPVFALLVIYHIVSVSNGQPNPYLKWGATVLFVLASMTDALDGYFARARNERTRLGTILDPLADKGLLLCALILLSGPWGKVFNPHIPIWYVLMVVSRDVLLIVGSGVIHATVGHVEVCPRMSGKISTVAQMAIIFWVLAQANPSAMKWMLAVAATFTLLSTVQYVLDGARQLEKAHAHEAPGHHA